MCFISKKNDESWVEWDILHPAVFFSPTANSGCTWIICIENKQNLNGYFHLSHKQYKNEIMQTFRNIMGQKGITFSLKMTSL
jgi:hypothetical protein